MTDRVIVFFYRLSARPSRRLVCLPALVMPSTSRHFHPHYFNQSTRSYFFTSTMKKDANTRLSAVLYNVFSSIVYNIRFMDGFRISSSIKSRQIKMLDIKCVCVNRKIGSNGCVFFTSGLNSAIESSTKVAPWESISPAMLRRLLSGIQTT